MTRSMAVLALSGLMCVGLGQGLEKQPAGQPGLPAGHPQLPAPGPAANWPKAKAEDVASIDAIMKAFYESVAGEPGQTRQWERYQSLFVPDARLIPARSGASGATALYLTVAEYIDANRVYFEKGGFFDTEVARRTEE